MSKARRKGWCPWCGFLKRRCEHLMGYSQSHQRKIMRERIARAA